MQPPSYLSLDNQRPHHIGMCAEYAVIPPCRLFSVIIHTQVFYLYFVKLKKYNKWVIFLKKIKIFSLNVYKFNPLGYKWLNILLLHFSIINYKKEQWSMLHFNANSDVLYPTDLQTTVCKYNLALCILATPLSPN